MPLISVAAKSAAGFRRAGMQFTRQPQVIDTATLTDAQALALISDRNLVVKDLDDDTNTPPPRSTASGNPAGGGKPSTDLGDTNTQQSSGTGSPAGGGQESDTAGAAAKGAPRPAAKSAAKAAAKSKGKAR